MVLEGAYSPFCAVGPVLMGRNVLEFDAVLAKVCGEGSGGFIIEM